MPDANPIAGAPVRARSAWGTGRDYERRHLERLERQLSSPGVYVGGHFLVCWLSKQCFRCDAIKPLSQFHKDSKKFDGRQVRCIDCVTLKRPKPRGWYQMTAQERVSARRDRKCRLKRDARVRAAAAQGRKLGAPATADIERRYKSLIERNARDAWKHWMAVRAPAEWLDAYWSAEPWKRPGLSEAEKYRLRYALDPTFLASERMRLKDKKYRQVSASDGTVTSALVRALMDQSHCSYCQAETGPEDRQLEHVHPISMGGRHSADNVVMACRQCNKRKFTTMPLQWLVSLCA